MIVITGHQSQHWILLKFWKIFNNWPQKLERLETICITKNIGKRKNKGPKYPQIREEWDGRRQFTIHGAFYDRCSGVRTFLEFEIPNVTKRRPGEMESEYLDRVAFASNMKFFKKFPEKGQSIRKLRLQLENMWNGLHDPIKFGGCKAIKIHYEDEPKNVFHWI